MIGSEFGRYKIVERLGAGGMGEVYRTEDTTLGRPVALKFLAAHLLNDDEAKQRFLREARAAAALHHPNICTVFEVAEENNKTFLAMAYLEGESLEERIAKGPLPLKDALEIGRQIAEGLEAAHEKGIIHRDIKPANIMVDGKGRATILDFGLARLVEASKLTRADQTVGTAAYMSPEQIQGAEVDQRADIWALGCVLYEMVAGLRPFKGQYDQALAYEIVNQEPEPLTAVRAGVPMELEFIVGECLAKDREDRTGAAQDVSRKLRTLADKLKSGRSTVVSRVGGLAGSVGPTRVDLPAQSDARVNSRTKREILAWAVACLFAFVALAPVVFDSSQTGPEALTTRFQIEPPEGIRFHRRAAEISPDGRQLAFESVSAEGTQLWVRSMDSLEARPLPGTENGVHPFWSPDSRFLGFFADSKLKKIDIRGGPAQTLCDAINVRGGTWAPGQNGGEGVIVFALVRGGLQSISDSGGEPMAVTVVDETTGEYSHRFPSFLPDGRHFLYTSRGTKGSAVFIGSLDLAGGARASSKTPIVRGDTTVRFAPAPWGQPNGHLLFALEDSLMAQEFDIESLRLSGQPFPVAEGVRASARGIDASDFSISQTGTLVYRATSSSWKSQLVWLGRDGDRIATVGKPGNQNHFSLSPDEDRVAMTENGDIWIYDLKRSLASRFTFDANSYSHTWSPDGERLAFTSFRGGNYDLYLKAMSGTAPAEPLPKTENAQLPAGWHPDGHSMLFEEQDPQTGWDLWHLPLDGDRKPTPYLQTEFRERMGRFSPDGRWVAYISDQSGRTETYVQSYPPDGTIWQVSTGGGAQPCWRGDGRELFYSTLDGGIMAVEVEPGTSFRPGIPVLLFRDSAIKNAGNDSRYGYAVSSDGRRFLVDVEIGGRVDAPVTIVQNWQSSAEDTR